MHLYSHTRSPWCRKVDWSIAEMGIQAHMTSTVLGAEGTDMKTELEAMKAKCGFHATLPTLVDGAFVLSESSSIVFYLADALSYDGPFLPRAPQLRALASQWDRIGDINLGANVLSPWLRNTTFLGEGKPDQSAFDKAREAFSKVEARVENALAGKAFLLGDTLSFADVGLAHIFTQLHRIDGPKVTGPKVSVWLEACVTRPSYQRLAARSS